MTYPIDYQLAKKGNGLASLALGRHRQRRLNGARILYSLTLFSALLLFTSAQCISLQLYSVQDGGMFLFSWRSLKLANTVDQ